MITVVLICCGLQFLLHAGVTSAKDAKPNHAAENDELSELHIGGIFPIAGKGGWQGGQACMPGEN